MSTVEDEDLPPIVVDRRHAGRKRVLFGGKIVHRDGIRSFDCMIRDLSDTGARVSAPAGEIIPTRAYFIDLRTGMAYESTVAWVRAPQYGLKFGSVYNLKTLTDPKFEFLKRVWSISSAPLSGAQS